MSDRARFVKLPAAGVDPDPRRRKHTFTSVAEARAALTRDRLGVVYANAENVAVVTSFGQGKFPRREWEASR